LVQDVAEVILRASVGVLNSQTRLLASSEKVLLRVLVGVAVVTVLVVLKVTESANHVGLIGRLAGVVWFAAGVVEGRDGGAASSSSRESSLSSAGAS
jgi:predicted membrane channel-forming protein YqfA (hemolysin III family)